jgi:L-amino acid N-acyltransferase YncA
MLAHVDQVLGPLSYHQWERLAAYHICRVLTAYLLSHQRGSLISLAIGDSVY